MILGCDIGTGFTKAVLLEGDKFVCGTRIQTEANPEKALRKALAEICARQKISAKELTEVVVTGWGQGKLSTSHRTETTMKWLQTRVRIMLLTATQAFSEAPFIQVIDSNIQPLLAARGR